VVAAKYMHDGIEKIVVFIVIALGILFLVYIVSWDGQRNLLRLGVAVALVIGALSVFLKYRK
jgi:hypothetical protein